MNMIKIKSLTDVRITRKTDHYISFTVAGEKYFVKECSDPDEYCGLEVYHRITSRKNEMVASKVTSMSLYNLTKTRMGGWPSKTTPYSQYNLFRFVFLMTELGFFSGYGECHVKRAHERVAKIDDEIKKNEERIQALRKARNSLLFIG